MISYSVALCMLCQAWEKKTDDDLVAIMDRMTSFVCYKWNKLVYECHNPTFKTMWLDIGNNRGLR